VGNYLMPPLIARFMADHPQCQLSLDIANTSQIIHALEQFELDIGFIEGFCHSPNLEAVPWQADELVVFAAPHSSFSPKAVNNKHSAKMTFKTHNGFYAKQVLAHAKCLIMP
jgi:DNA-binding transcriptional LysR family regulator